MSQAPSSSCVRVSATPGRRMNSSSSENSFADRSSSPVPRHARCAAGSRRRSPTSRADRRPRIFAPSTTRARMAPFPPATLEPDEARTTSSPHGRERLLAEPDLADDLGALLVRDPARIDRAVLAVRQPARAGEAGPANLRDVTTADVAARQVLALERRRLQRLRRGELLCADEELLGPLGLADEPPEL